MRDRGSWSLWLLLGSRVARGRSRSRLRYGLHMLVKGGIRRYSSSRTKSGFNEALTHTTIKIGSLSLTTCDPIVMDHAPLGIGIH